MNPFTAIWKHYKAKRAARAAYTIALAAALDTTLDFRASYDAAAALGDATIALGDAVQNEDISANKAHYRFGVLNPYCFGCRHRCLMCR